MLVSLAGRLRGSVGVSWRYGVANLSRRRAESLVQIVAFGTGIMVLLLLGLVRNDLANDWQLSLPPDIPNFFFISIPNDPRDAFMSDLTARGAHAVARDADDSRTAHRDQRNAERPVALPARRWRGVRRPRTEPDVGGPAGSGQSRRRRSVVDARR